MRSRLPPGGLHPPQSVSESRTFSVKQAHASQKTINVATRPNHPLATPLKVYKPGTWVTVFGDMGNTLLKCMQLERGGDACLGERCCLCLCGWNLCNWP